MHQHALGLPDQTPRVTGPPQFLFGADLGQHHRGQSGDELGVLQRTAVHDPRLRCIQADCPHRVVGDKAQRKDSPVTQGGRGRNPLRPSVLGAKVHGNDHRFRAGTVRFRAYRVQAGSRTHLDLQPINLGRVLIRAGRGSHRPVRAEHRDTRGIPRTALQGDPDHRSRRRIRRRRGRRRP